MADRPEIEGSLIANKEVITVLNLYKMLGIELPQEQDHRVEDLGEADKAKETSSPPEAEAAGWGLLIEVSHMSAMEEAIQEIHKRM